MKIALRATGQILTHDVEKEIISDNVGVTSATIELDESWDGLHIVIGFENGRERAAEPLKDGTNEVRVPVNVLRPGKLKIVVVGFNDEADPPGVWYCTKAWTLKEAIDVAPCGAVETAGANGLSGSIARAILGMIHGGGGEVPEDEVATSDEFDLMMEPILAILDGDYDDGADSAENAKDREEG